MRYLSRHLQATVQDLVERHLAALGWLDPADAPFGALPVIVQRARPSESQLQAIEPNLVAVSFGEQGDETDAELGAGVTSSDHVLFVDVLAESGGVGLALAEDVRDLLTGRASYDGRTASRYFRVEDQRTAPPTPVDGLLAEWAEVFREPAERQLPGTDWQVLRASIVLDTTAGA